MLQSHYSLITTQTPKWGSNCRGDFWRIVRFTCPFINLPDLHCVGLHSRAPQWWETSGATTTRSVIRQGRHETHQRAWDHLPGPEIRWDAAEGETEVCSSPLPCLCVLFLAHCSDCTCNIPKKKSSGRNVSMPPWCTGSSCVFWLCFVGGYVQFWRGHDQDPPQSVCVAGTGAGEARPQQEGCKGETGSVCELIFSKVITCT